MRAVLIREPGPPEVLVVSEVEQPKPGPDEVLVQVAGTAVNRADLLQRQGKYPAPAGIRDDIPGLEFSGRIAAVGERVTGWSEGDRVMGLAPGEAYAEFVTAHERLLLRVPDSLDLTKAAGIPEVFLTAFDALFLQADLKAGEWALIHAVGSGVGTAAVQLVREAGGKTVGSASTAEKLVRAQGLGLDHPVNYREQDVVSEVERATGDRGVNVVLDLVGAVHWDANMAAMADKGRMIVVGTVSGPVVEKVFLPALMSKRLTVRGTVLRTRPLEEKAALTQEFARRVLPFFDDRQITPVIDRVLPLADAAEGHRVLEANENFGKVVLAVD